MAALGVSERRAGRVLGQHHSTRRKPPRAAEDEAGLTAEIVALARRYGRYGYRRITALLRRGGWVVNAKRVERIWRREGLKVPQWQPKRGRLWLADGSCIRCRRWGRIRSGPTTSSRTALTTGGSLPPSGRCLKARMLTVIDEFTRESLAMVVARRLSSDDVLAAFTELFTERGPPEHIRSDQGPEFIALVVKEWLGRLGVGTLYIEKASPWENGYDKSFKGKLRNELLDREIFYSLAEARVLIKRWRIHYNTERPHSSLGYRPPAPETIRPPR
ncbi:MAG: IS3 family transposase [Burkholderiaceae bacterium]|nr:IS3 family transposase [Burkholderiaceae bacterium]